MPRQVNLLARLRLLLLMVGLLALAEGANAACVSPAGNVGDVRYASNYGVMAFCNGTGWVSMAGGVSVTVNTGGGGATPAGSSADVQFNGSGALAADTGNFTYASGLLTAPNISTAAITASGLGTFGSALVNGGMTVTGQASITTISTTRINVAPSVSTVISLNGGSGNIISSGSAVVSTSSAGSVTVFSGGSAQMLVAGSGVGIGTLTPNAPLVVQKDGTDYARVRVRNTNAAGGSGFYFGTDADSDYASFIIANNTSNTAYAGANALAIVNSRGPLAFFASTAGVLERMRIDTNGNMQLATTATYAGANSRLSIAYAGGGTMHGIALKPVTDGTNPIDFLNASGSYVGSISQNTTNTTYNTTSDRRVKEEITDTREGLQKLMQLPVRDFAFRADPSHTIVTGFIAQELEKVFPEAVTTNGDNGETPLRDQTKPWSVDYGRVTPLIVKAVQDLNLKTEKEIMALKVDNDNLRRELGELREELGKQRRATRRRD